MDTVDEVADEQEYILGTDRDELERLEFQHQVWVAEGYTLWRRAGFAAGETLLDLGCGPGFTSFELAHVVGSEGRVIARDESRRFLDHLAAQRRLSGRTQVEPSVGRIEDLELDPGSVDGAYARWVFCWMADPGASLRRVFRCLRPGGVLALQEYLDWGGLKLAPHSTAVERAVAACMKSWEVPIDVGQALPGLAHETGFVLEHFEPCLRAGPPGSLEWRWIGGFLHAYLPKLVERGLLSASELEDFRSDWAARTAAGTDRICAPVMVSALLRRPGSAAGG